MTVTELLLNAKNTPLSARICQTAIQTEEDKLRYQENGYYSAELTENEFREKFPGSIDPANIFYTPSVSCSSLYFNQDTLAVCPFHLSMLLMPAGDKYLAGTIRAIENCERDAAEGCFASAITGLPDRMRLDYFALLVQRFGSNVKDLYKLFFYAYCTSDYGFKDLDLEILNTILQSKTDADREQTAAVLADLPDIVTIYRGVNTESTDYHEAYSWTLDVNVANFFASRLGNGPGTILKANIRKSEIIEAFLGDRGNGEEEIIVHPKSLEIIEFLPLSGEHFLKINLPKVAPLYHEYKDKLQSLQFTHASEDHGVLHELRVLLLTQLIAEELNLPEKERRILAMAAIYHDTCRTHDWDDEKHGRAAGQYYWKNEKAHNPVVKYLCEYHCLPDDEGYRKARTDATLCSYGKNNVLRLLKVFKDADTLDRVRFGIRELDWNQLRLSVSRALPLVARICVDQVRP